MIAREMLKMFSGERYALEFRFIIEAVANTRDGQNQLWPLGDWLDFLT